MEMENITQLNEDCLKEILSYLPPLDKLRFHEAFSTPTHAKEVICQSFDTTIKVVYFRQDSNTCEAITLEELFRILQLFGAKVKDLTIVTCCIDQKPYFMFGESNTTYTVTSMISVNELANALGRVCHNLVSIHLLETSCDEVDLDVICSIQKLIQLNDKLKAFQYLCYYDTDSKYDFTKLPQTIEDLSYGGSIVLPEMILPYLPNLKSLSLCSVIGMNKEIYDAIGSNASRLTSLTLQHFENTRDYFCHDVLINIGKLKNLKRLEICGKLINASDVDFVHMASKCTQIRVLYLGYLTNFEMALEEMLFYLKDLEILSLKFLNKVTNIRLKNNLDNLQELQLINMSPSILRSSIVSAIRAMPNLSSLIAKNMGLIPENTINLLCKICTDRGQQFIVATAEKEICVFKKAADLDRKPAIGRSLTLSVHDDDPSNKIDYYESIEKYVKELLPNYQIKIINRKTFFRKHICF